MKKLHIIAWGTNSPLGFDFNEDDVFESRDEAIKEIKEELSEEDTAYTVREVGEVFLYLHAHLNESDLNAFTDDEKELEEVYDFFENVKDNRLIKRYLDEALRGEFYTYSRVKFIDREINYLSNLKK